MATTLVEIVQYNAAWAEEFIILAKPIREQMQNLAIRIDHIGSTSVSNLAAKDRIDLQVTIASANHFALAKSKLEKLAYKESTRVYSDHIPPAGPFDETEWEKRFYSPPQNQRATNLHVRVQGKANQRYALLFRDYLRAHPLIASAYAQAKKQIAFYHKNDIEAYCDLKDPICDIIFQNAQIWAENTGWLLGPSDA